MNESRLEARRRQLYKAKLWRRYLFLFINLVLPLSTIVFQVPLECLRPLLTFSRGELVCAVGRRLNRSCAASKATPPVPLTLPPCAMSRGRGGSSREQYPRHPPPNLPAKENYCRPFPPSLYPRPGPQQVAFPSSYHGPSHPTAPFQPPAPFANATASPFPNHNKVASNLTSSSSSYSPQHCPVPGTKAFHEQQVAFLKQTREWPRFRADPPSVATRGVTPGRQPSSLYQLSSGYDRYSDPNNSNRTHDSDSQEQSFRYPSNVRGPRSFPDPRYLIQSQLRGQRHNVNSSRSWGPEKDSLSHRFQRFSLQDRPQRGEQLDRYGTPSCSPNVSFARVNITLNPAIQDQVHAALFALQPSESVSAKSLAKKLRLPKKVVNKALYSLERSQKASKKELQPPKWTLYKVHPPAVSSTLPAPQQHGSEQAERNFRLVPIKKEDSDTESSSSNDSDSSESTDSQEPAGQLHQDKDYTSTTLSADQDPKPPTMTDQKEFIFQYLLHSQEATSLVIAKNLGLRNAKQVNPTLYALEKLGDVVRNKDVIPPTWELSAHRRERMERSLRATQGSCSEGTPMELEGLGLGLRPSSPLPPLPGLELLPFSEGFMPERNNSEQVSCISVCLFLKVG